MANKGTEIALNLGLRQDFMIGYVAFEQTKALISTFGYAEGAITSPITCGIITQCLLLRPGAFLEIGTRYGGSALVARRFTNKVVTIDPGYDEEYRAVIEKAKITDITKIVKPSENVKRLPKADYTVGFIDGLHEYDQIMKYDFPLMEKYVKGFVIFDDVDIAQVDEAIVDLAVRGNWKLLYYHYPSTAVITNLELSKKLHLGLV